MIPASQNETQQTLATREREQRAIARRLSQFPRERLAHVKELISLLEEADDEEERVEIAKTLLEVLFPKSQGGIGSFEEDAESEARERLDAYRKNVGQAIRQQRETLGMTQEQLAELAGIPQSHVSRLECGKHAPSHLTIKRVAAALKTTPSRLDPGFSDEDEDATK